MKISWSELFIIIIFLFITSGIIRPIIRKVYKVLMEVNNDFSGRSRAGKSAPSGSSDNSQPSNNNEKEAPESSVQEGRDPYKILNIDNTASREEILSAYRKLAQMYHPDKVAGLAPEYREIAERKMKIINDAYKKVRK
jgi:DnaJ-class molecular chaperone